MTPAAGRGPSTDGAPQLVTSAQGGARVRIPPPAVYVAMTAVGLGLRYLFPLVRIGEPGNWAAAGAVGLPGFALLAWAHGLFRRTGQDPRPWKPSPSLIREGPYRYSRNPIYVAMTILQIATGLAVDDFWIVLLAVPALAVVHITAVVHEEAYLREKFGEPYERFCREVRRYL